MCIAGITPGPYSPDPQTFNHLLGPLVDELIRLDAGIIIPTHQFPAGRLVQVKLLCIYGDVLATKKVAGYASHSATKFCSFCHAEQSKLHLLQLSRRREKDETISAAVDSKNATSTTEQDNLLKASGVRWSELNRLHYWDPSRHVVLGVMHNWLEGILQGHFRYRWRFGWVPPSQKKKKRQNGSRSTTRPNKRTRTAIESIEIAMDLDDDDIEYQSDEDDDILLNSGLGGSFFTEGDVERFRAAMKHIVLPPGVPHLPHNLGEASHGKLSASQWHALYVFVIPLVICELYIDEVGAIDLHSNRYKFLANTAQLVQCTNVVFARKFKQGDIKRFEMHYKKYSQSVQELFENIKVQPNHHFALHTPQQMSDWGPLVSVAEFAGERLIGFLQKINTNNKIDEMHQSMITRGCRLQRMLASSDYNQLANVLDDNKPQRGRQTKSILLCSSRYTMLFNHVANQDRSVVKHGTFPVPRHGWVLSGLVTPIRSIDCNGVVVGSVSPRNCVVANVAGKMRYGLVRQCYQYKNRLGEDEEFLVMSTITNMYPKRTDACPTRPFRYLLFLFGMVVGRVEDTEQVVFPTQIVSLAAYRLLDDQTFGIPTNGIALIPHGYDACLNIAGNC
ncbi:uncharacterized protein PGTG_12287 [Puccinia graminis f. sp. tritici CRL 75-36-700-3]|uniref:Uncharacterized protein n=1 Tax=Puccinia graminis f. sp. tritici (strain CRL 75-36-700-3 / race SCCL) TaxID=418459 RepID=E3KPU6_PUCGT|nr:uncharacterized protein PGTG_12287 [Puccinia graminis f. sp. tritici CRL 75-36-700-3]EFP86331.2 hypothetical protein PGTG_12287 [Puccinia graminis f. sp. tritici CRL 75-36-700-3]